MKKTVRRFLSVIFTALLAIGCFALSVSASETAAFAFDNDTGASLWKIDNTELAASNGFGFDITDTESYDGAGSLAVFESLTGEIDPALVGGAYITASDIGLTDFAGCTITAQIFPSAVAAAQGAQFVLYTDGMIYLPLMQTELTPNEWNSVSLIIPDNCKNTRLGFLAPIYTTFAGDAFYLDEITITLPDGSTVPNVGDYVPPAENAESGISDGLAALIYTLLALLAIAVVGVVILAIYKRSKRYR
ncbi:MAG: hypothetical protein LBL80_03830 [Ruminococcus sp.]|nr:hypothetical protein [Ruminococcus sp.]